MHDARLLATYVEEPKKVSQEQLALQVKEIDSTDLAARFVTNVVAKAEFCETCASQWTQSQEEYVKQCGFLLITALAKAKNKLLDMYFTFYLEQICREAQQERNWVREAMNYALIAIGSRNPGLRGKALEAAERMGPLEVDYGDAPDAAAVLRKQAPAA